MIDYQKYEFCKAVKCDALFAGADSKCFFLPEKCKFTAKEFHEWLNKNGFFITKLDRSKGNDKPKSETHLLDQLESGPWPSFVEDMKKNAAKFHPNCYHCHHQSAIVGCDYRFNDECDGETKYEQRRTK